MGEDSAALSGGEHSRRAAGAQAGSHAACPGGRALDSQHGRPVAHASPVLPLCSAKIRPSVKPHTVRGYTREAGHSGRAWVPLSNHCRLVSLGAYGNGPWSTDSWVSSSCLGKNVHRLPWTFTQTNWYQCIGFGQADPNNRWTRILSQKRSLCDERRPSGKGGGDSQETRHLRARRNGHGGAERDLTCSRPVYHRLLLWSMLEPASARSEDTRAPRHRRGRRPGSFR